MLINHTRPSTDKHVYDRIQNNSIQRMKFNREVVLYDFKKSLNIELDENIYIYIFLLR